MSFGVTEVEAKVPYVQTQKITFGVVTQYPRWKYHKKYPQGLLINNEEEEAALGDGWHDSPAAFGVETHPSVDAKDEVQVRLAKIREAIAATK